MNGVITRAAVQRNSKKKKLGFLDVHVLGPAGAPLGKALQNSQNPLVVIRGVMRQSEP